MAKNELRHLTVRIDDKTLDKLHYVADYEGRSVNSHVLVLIRESIKTFEETHGSIRASIDPDVNVKPSRK